MIKEHNIKKWVVILPILGVVFTSIILTTFYISKIQSFYKKEIENTYINNKNHSKQIIKNRINIVRELIDKNFEPDPGEHKREYVINKSKEILNNINFSQEGYIFAYDFKGNTIAHIKKELIGKNRWTLKINNKFIIQEFVQTAKISQNGFFQEYKATVNPKTNLSEEKVSFIQPLKNIDWIIGTGIYIDNIKSTTIKKESSLNNQLFESIKKIILISIGVTLFGIVIMTYISNKIYAIFRRYQHIIIQKNIDLEKKVIKRTEEQNSLLELFNNADTILFKWDYKKDKFTYMSNSIKNILGYDKQKFLQDQTAYKEFIHPDDIKQYNDEYETEMENNTHYFEHSPYRLLTKDKKIKWIHDCKLIVKNNDNDLLYSIGYMTDITKIKNQEDSLINQTKMLALNEMIGNIAHQWRQPLSVISVAASGIKLHNELGILDDENIDTSVSGILKNCNYLSETINNFHELSKPNDEKNIFNIKDIVNKTIHLLHSNIKPNGIDVIIDNDNELNIYANEQKTIQVIMHIVNNSIDELIKKPNGIHKYIFISIVHEHKDIKILIKDNAGGIKNKHLNKIFEPYFTTKHQSQGAGLDLYISQKIIQDMKGTITVENQEFIYEENKFTGALFTINLPKHRSNLDYTI